MNFFNHSEHDEAQRLILNRFALMFLTTENTASTEAHLESYRFNIFNHREHSEHGEAQRLILNRFALMFLTTENTASTAKHGGSFFMCFCKEKKV